MTVTILPDKRITLYMRNQTSYLVKGLLTGHLLLFLTFISVSGQIDFPVGSQFRYLKGKDAQYLSASWISSSFDDSGWDLGSAPIRYGDGEGGTVLDDMMNGYSTVYMRSSFTAHRVDSLRAIQLLINYDDGFAIWINGKEVLNENAPSLLAYDGFAPENHESGQFESFLLEPEGVELVEGENTLAIQGFNVSLTSSDFYFDLEMEADVMVPVVQDTAGLTFSVQSGFFEDPFYLEIVAADPSWDVIYTLDGSNPQYSGTSVTANHTATILVDPDSNAGRPVTPAFIVRASSASGDAVPSVPESRTFIFLDRVLHQADPGGGWPAGNVNGQIIDLEMDDRISDDPDYKELMIPSLTDIPSISIITDLDNLFDPGTGIYVNAWGHGFAWERECSAELLDPDGSEGFNVNAGLRIRGGWSRHNDFPKHAFRLFFRSDYGDAKLDYPLFGDEGVDRYDKIDLRTSQNYAWAQGDSRNTMLRDVFSRDLQGDMDQPYTRSRYYHLYLNGMYWGLFQTQERSEARFAADYLGGSTDDYDVIKVNTENWQYRIEATDGFTDAWNTIWDMCGAGFQDNAAYFSLQGKDASGNPVAGGEVLVDIDNLIDYMLTIFYTGNFDAPTSSFGGNQGPNNFFAIYNREDPSSGFVFFNHDAEHAMFSEAASPGIGLNENRVTLGNMSVSQFASFHPQWLHHKLTDNAEYRIRFADRATRYFEDGGLLTPEKNLERLNERAAEIEMAMIAESARWGDSKRGTSFPFTRDDNWIPEVNKIRNDFIPYRSEIVIGQLEDAGLYPILDAPDFYLNGTLLQGTEAHVNGPSSLLIDNISQGAILYTVDGSDPRSPGGSVAPSAKSGGVNQVELEFSASAVVNARIHYQDEWSALKEVWLVADQDDYSRLAITELHYHPQEMVYRGDTIPGEDLEFIEFKNTGTDAVNLSGLVLDSAVYYEFPEDALLPPGQFYVVVSKPAAFFKRYGMVASGNYQRNFANEGEEVLLTDRDGKAVIAFIYHDDMPWPVKADGEGYSLVSAENDPVGNPAIYSYWKASCYVGGSPFRDDPEPTSANPAEPVGGEIQLYPNPTSDILNIRLPSSWAQEEAYVQVFGIRGDLVYQSALPDDMSIRLDQLNITPGIYVVRISGSDIVFTQKIIFR
jgi:hypothetical protein